MNSLEKMNQTQPITSSPVPNRLNRDQRLQVSFK